MEPDAGRLGPGPRGETHERPEQDTRRGAEDDARYREEDDCAAHRQRGLLGCISRLRSRRAEQHESDDLDEAEDRERRSHGKRRERDRPRGAVGDVAVGRDVQQRLEGQPLRREAVQRRQPRDRHRAHEECTAGPRHPPQQPAEPVDLERADHLFERARAEEQQRLEDGVVQRVEECRCQRECSPDVRAAGA